MVSPTSDVLSCPVSPNLSTSVVLLSGFLGVVGGRGRLRRWRFLGMILERFRGFPHPQCLSLSLSLAMIRSRSWAIASATAARFSASASLPQGYQKGFQG